MGMTGALLVSAVYAGSSAPLPEGKPTTPVVTAQLSTNQLREIARSITVKVHAGDSKGSGILVAKDGTVYTVLTNAHVSDQGQPYLIETPDGQVHPARVKVKGAALSRQDLALMQFKSVKSYSLADLGDSATLTQNQTVFAAGFPIETEQFTLTPGKVSFLAAQPLMGGYQIGFTNATQQGMSGGALLSQAGKVVGVLGQGAAAILNGAYVYQDGSRPTAQVLQQMRQVGFAIPVTVALQDGTGLAVASANSEQSPTLSTQAPLAESSHPSRGQSAERASVLTSQPITTNSFESSDQPTQKSAIASTPAANNQVAQKPAVVNPPAPNNQATQKPAIANPPTYTGIAASVDKIAQAVVVRIESNAEKGSGVIVARQGQTYFVLTANHVVAKPDQYEVVTPDGQRHGINSSTTQQFEGVDIALVQFTSQATYPVATLADYYIGLDDRPLVFVSGFPGQATNATRKLTAGTVFPQANTMIAAQNAYSLADGSELVYTNLSQRGMSGGPVFDHLGRVIGINTASENELKTNQAGQEVEIQLGYSLGVPIRTFLGLTAKANLNTKLLKVETTAPPSLSKSEIDAIRNSLFNEPAPTETASAEEWLNYGNQLWRLAKFPEATAAIDRAIRRQSDFYQAHYVRGITLHAQDKFQEAAAAFSEATRIRPDFTEAWRMQGEALNGLKQYAEALAAFDRAIQSQADDPLLYVRRGETLDSLNRFAEARDTLTQAIKLKPNYFAYGLRARSQFMLKDYPAAIADASKAIELQPNDYFNRTLRGTIYASLGNSQASMTDLNQAIELFPASNQYRLLPYMTRGTSRLILKDLPGAIADFTKVISETKTKEDFVLQAYIGRAQVYASQKEFPKAIADATQAIELWPKNVTNYYQRGGFYAQAKEYQNAIADFTKAIALQPDYADAYRFRGTAYSELKDLQRAIADFKKATELYTAKITRDPQNPELFLNRSIARWALQDNAGALQDAQKAEQLFRDQGATAGSVGMQLAQNLQKAIGGKSSTQRSSSRTPEESTSSSKPANQSAIATGSEGRTSSSGDIDSGLKQGEARFNAGDYQGAVTVYSRVIAQQPTSLKAYAGRAQAYVKLQNFQAAINDVEKIIELQPNNDAAIKLRDLLRLQLSLQPGTSNRSTPESTPKTAIAYLQRGIQRMKAQNYQGVIEDTTQVIQMEPDNAAAYVLRGYARRELKDYRGSRADFNRAIELQPSLASQLPR
jgi:tetratricopeptide (TPR) repeat protein/S1-C subfamily serine protease